MLRQMIMLPYCPVLRGTAVKPLEYQDKLRALEQNLNLTM